MKATFRYEHQVNTNDLDVEERTFLIKGNSYVYENGKWFDIEGLEVINNSLLAELGECLADSLQNWLFDELEETSMHTVIEYGDLTFE